MMGDCGQHEVEFPHFPNPEVGNLYEKDRQGKKNLDKSVQVSKISSWFMGFGNFSASDRFENRAES